MSALVALNELNALHFWGQFYDVRLSCRTKVRLQVVCSLFQTLRKWPLVILVPNMADTLGTC